MNRVYYEIQMTARQLTVALVLLAIALIGAFLLGYGAGVSVSGHAAGSTAAGPPGPVAEVVITPPPQVTASVAEARPPTATPRPAATATPRPTATAVAHTPAPRVTKPTATATPRPKPSPTRPPAGSVGTHKSSAPPGRPMVPRREGFWVQVLAARHPEAIAKARTQLVGLDFPKNHHWVLQAPTAEGAVLYKLRIGPFPDRPSAERVAVRMRNAGFPDAWVVVP